MFLAVLLLANGYAVVNLARKHLEVLHRKYYFELNTVHAEESYPLFIYHLKKPRSSGLPDFVSITQLFHKTHPAILFYKAISEDFMFDVNASNLLCFAR